MNDFDEIGKFGNYGELVNLESPYTVKTREDLLNLLPKNNHFNSLIEFGCADGKNLIYFQDALKIESENCFGVDICDSIKNENKSFKFEHSSIENFLNDNKKKYDLVLLSDVLEHLYNPWECLDKIYNILNKEGYILISVPNLQNLKYLNSVVDGNFFYEKTGLFDQTHIRFFSQNTLTKYLEKVNFKIVKLGWRPDGSLLNLKNQMFDQLANKTDVALQNNLISVRINKENIENYFSQQILISAKKI